MSLLHVFLQKAAPTDAQIAGPVAPTNSKYPAGMGVAFSPASLLTAHADL
jgi:hypothetical protein